MKRRTASFPPPPPPPGEDVALARGAAAAAIYRASGSNRPVDSSSSIGYNQATILLEVMASLLKIPLSIGGGPSNVVAEYLKVLGDDALQSLTSLINPLALNPAMIPTPMLVLFHHYRLALLEKPGSTAEQRKHRPIAVQRGRLRADVKTRFRPAETTSQQFVGSAQIPDWRSW